MKNSRQASCFWKVKIDFLSRSVPAPAAASASAGADKGSAVGGGGDGGATQAQMLRVLERIEAAIAEGVTTLRAPQRA